MNTQKIEKQVLGGGLDVIEVFKTIQGEGVFSGKQAVFIRLAGCNLQCPMCDTNYTLGRVTVDADTVFEEVVRKGGGCGLVVITGGEPFRQDITSLTKLLLEVGYTVQIETNGTLYLEGFPYEEVHICCSPKTPKINAALEKHVDSWKYVIGAEAGVMPNGMPKNPLGMPTPPHKATSGRIFLQPLDSKDEVENMKSVNLVVDLVMSGFGDLSLQTHKIIAVA